MSETGKHEFLHTEFMSLQKRSRNQTLLIKHPSEPFQLIFCAYVLYILYSLQSNTSWINSNIFKKCHSPVRKSSASFLILVPLRQLHVKGVLIKKNQPFLTPCICLPNVRRKFASFFFPLLGKTARKKKTTQPQETSDRDKLKILRKHLRRIIQALLSFLTFHERQSSCVAL